MGTSFNLSWRSLCARVARIGLAGAVAVVFYGAVPGVALAQADGLSWDGVWQAASQVPAPVQAGEPWVRPNRFQAAVLDTAVVTQLLTSAPLEDTPEAANPLLLTLPTPDGAFAQFYVWEAPIMEPGLAAQFPDIKTYIGQGIDDPAATARLDMTPLGFHAQVRSPNGHYYIDPYTKGDNSFYASYYKRDLTNIHDFECEVADAGSDAVMRGLAAGDDRSSGGTRRTYRLANACTGEYAAYFGGTVTAAQAAIVTAINRVTGVYETECAIRMTLVANNTSIVYTNSSTDPYTNNNGSTMLGQNISTCNSVIGSANYDIGHVFSTGGGGVAYLGAVCTSSKAGGVTGSGAPVGDAYYIDYVAHEMGHQFGANHNFNGTAGSCGGGNRNASTAYEPGSASTIMGYAGICSGDNLQAHSDAYFSADSYREIMAYVTSGSGSGCAATASTGNNPPTVNAGANYTIPKQTPIQLTATGNDPDGDTLTYFWEERDLGPAQSASGGIIADNGSSPFIRPWTPATSPSRTIPRLSNLLANTFAFGEQLPNTSRTVNFRCTARDNRAGGGGVNFDDMVITVTSAAGPFQVTSPNTAVSWAGTKTVTWNVASTSAAPVSCANVRILLSTDGGNTWPTVLLASTANNGSASVTLPNISTSTARIRVEAVGNIFFDISNVNFTITPAGTPPSITGQPSNQTVCSGGSVDFTVTATGDAPLSYQWRKGTTNLVNSGNISGATIATMTIDPALPGDAATNYNCVVTNASGSATSNNASLTVNTAPAVGTQPQSQTVCAGDPVTFTVAATGPGPLGYQWRKNGSDIGGATNSSYTINPVGTGDAGNYDCVVTNACGSDTSDPATLTVDTAPDITTDPSSQTVAPGGPVTFTVAASGTAPLSYQWRKDGGDISGANSSSYTINPVSAGDAGGYDCVVTNLCGSATSNAATLTVSSVLLGDMNCDGVVNNQDIDPFVLALFDPVGYAQAYPGCNILNGDFTGDGNLNNQDIDPFVAVLFG